MTMRAQAPGIDPFRGPRRGALVLLATLMATLTGALAWSTWAELDISATGTGRIVPSMQVQVVQNLEGGIVRELLVKEGATVRAGQTIAQIQNVEFAGSYRETQENVAGLEAAIARLTGEVEGKAPVFPPALRAAHPDLVSKEQKHYVSRKAELAAALESLRQEAERGRNAAKRASENLPMLEASLLLAHEQREIVEPQVRKGLISRVELINVDQRILELRTKVNEARREIPAAEAAVEGARQRMEGERQKYRSQALAQLKEAKIKLAGQLEALTTQKDRLSRRALKSPVDGIVKKLFVTSVGAVLKPGDSFAEVVPTGDDLIVEARFSPKDIAFIHPGQRSWIRVTAYDASIYGAMPAEVVQVSADATVTERDEIYYLVRVRATGGFDARGEKQPLLPGMVAEADVVTGKRTIFEYLAKPVMKLQYTAMHER